MPATTDTPTIVEFSYPRVIAMSRSGQPGAVMFDNTNVSKFLEDWDSFCSDYGISDQEKVERLPRYCADPATKESVKLFPGYAAKDWKSLRSDLGKSFHAFHNRDDTMMVLRKLVKMEPKPDLHLYVLKYSSLSTKLVSKKILSPVDRVAHFVDSLDNHLRRKALQFCLKSGWTLSSYDDDDDDSEKKEPEFDKLTDFILSKVDLSRFESAFDTDRALRNGQVVDTYPVTPLPMPSTSVSLLPTPVMPKPNSGSATSKSPASAKPSVPPPPTND